jgi:2-methylcitrate dehydratase PrpD
MTGLTQVLAAFVFRGAGGLSDEVAAIIRSGFIDTVGTMVAGRAEPAVSLVRGQLAGRGGTAREASILLSQERTYSADAALINGVAGHALDYDDVALGGHPSTVLVPAILTEGERLGASGADAMDAYAVGYEVWAELVAREPDPHHVKGWHPTGVFGTIAAAAAVARLHRLTAAQAAQSMALAGSMASGLVANFGTMTKPLHAGRAASAGIEAVRLVMRGFTASPDALEHHAGFLAALSPHGSVDRDTSPGEALGTRLGGAGLSIKRYPLCYATHRVIDAVLGLATDAQLKPEQVTRVEASIGGTQASMLRNHDPHTGLEAKFSLEFAVASALVARRVGLSELTDGFVARPDVRAIFPKVTIATRDTQCPVEPIFALTDQVWIHTADGAVLDSGEVRFARGNAKLPLTLPELQLKFLDCAKALPEAQALFRRLSALEDVADLAELVATATAVPEPVG